MNRQVLFKSRPEGLPTAANFELIETPIGRPRDGEILRRTIYLSVDPYMRGRMNPGKSYVPPMEPGQMMVGQTVSQVLDSKHPDYKEGDLIIGDDGWQTHAIGTAKGLRKLDPKQGPISYALGALGGTGLTAYVALLDIGKPKPGETVVVSAAAGAVGSIAGQIARIKGCRAVGIVGSDEKCEFVTRELRFDAYVNYKKDLLPQLKAACPNGIDVYVDNVGGPVLEAVLKIINKFARIPLVGLISQYNDARLQPGPNLGSILVNRAMIQGMIVFDHMHRFPDFLRDMSQWVRSGEIKVAEDIVEGGIDIAPDALIGLFRGENVGKRLVKISEDPTR